MTLSGQFSYASKPQLNTLPDQYFKKISNSRSQFNVVQKGETVYSILRNHSFSEAQIQLTLAEEILPKKFALAKGQKYKVTKVAQNSFLEIRFYDLPRDTSFVFWRDFDEAGAFETVENFNIKNRTFSGKIRGSILSSIMEKVNDDWIAMRFIDAYALDYNLQKVLQRGAPFSLTLEEKYDGPTFVGYGEVIQTQLEINGKIETRRFVAFSGGGSYINAIDQHIARPLYLPVNYLRISSFFAPRRLHPIKNRRQPHMGVDFELPQGEDIYAARSGQVLRTGRTRAAGNFVVIRHLGGFETFYNHMATIQANLRPGTSVVDGQKLGTVGCTGYCTRPHLHFAVKKNGRYLNPVDFLKSYPFSKRALISQRRANFSEDSESL